MLPTILLSLLLAPAPAAEVAHELRELALPGGGRLRYAIVEPAGEREGPVPALLAFPSGSQGERMVNVGLTQHWGAQAAARGWLVVSPVGEDGRRFEQGPLEDVSRLLEQVAAEHEIEGGAFHVAGAGAGGLAAFRFAVRHPLQTRSLLLFPGGPSSADDLAGLDRLRGRPVRVRVDELDADFRRLAEQSVRLLAASGVDATLEISPGADGLHLALVGEGFMDWLESVRSGLDSAPAGGGGAEGVERLLDAVLEAEARSDAAAWASALAPGAIVLGPGEAGAGGRAASLARLEAGRGRTFLRLGREVRLAPDGRSAWFVERLQHERWGECRATGTAVLTEEGWRLAQHALSLSVPPERAEDVRRRLRRAGSRR